MEQKIWEDDKGIHLIDEYGNEGLIPKKNGFLIINDNEYSMGSRLEDRELFFDNLVGSEVIMMTKRTDAVPGIQLFMFTFNEQNLEPRCHDHILIRDSWKNKLSDYIRAG